jgi:hypothetical protein
MSDTESASFIRALRRDPAHATELAVLYALPRLAPHAVDAANARSADRGLDRLASRMVRRTVKRSRLDGAMMGTSLYVALPAAVISVYCRQLLMVLRIAALYGHDPADPRRAAEALVIAGHQPTVQAAARALKAAADPAPRSHRARLRAALHPALSQLATIIGVNLKGWRSQPVVDKVLSVLQMASAVIPFVGIPSNAAGTARASKQIGRAAIAFYGESSQAAQVEIAYALPPPPGPAQRRRLLATAVVICSLAVLVPLLVAGSVHALLAQWVLLALAELFLITTFTRLLWITR